MASTGFVICAFVALASPAWLATTPWRLRQFGRELKAEPLPARNTAFPDKDEQASEHAMGLIDLLFALVFTLPVVISADSFAHPFQSNVPFMLATVVALYVVIRSFVDWHIAMEDAPYGIRTSYRTLELWRVYFDIAIVVAYVILFMSSKPLVSDGGADLGQYVGVLAIIFLLYMGWGVLRALTYEPHEFPPLTLAIAAAGLAAVWGAYRIGVHSGKFFDGHGDVRNTVTLVVAGAIYAAYRKANWHAMKKFKSPEPEPDGQQVG